MSEGELADHNLLGVLMVTALLVALVFQMATGSFTADENTFTNPGLLNYLIDEHTGTPVRKIYVSFLNIPTILAGIHIVVVLLYCLVKK